ncbi:carboxymuconolactone decarboxylase family protein [Streptomyces sp. NPDC049954]|uniref:carboxymuconolactone decarboxylase family protein n=1 Tax=Streptomyces sp. NPDC049954 TaxID=3155779 RepID=UPI00343B0C85
MFPVHTIESAPEESRAAMRRTAGPQGRVMPAVGRLASSPELLNGFLALSAAFEGATLDAPAREVVVLTVAVRNGCETCVRMHTARLRGLDVAPEVVAALLEQRLLPDERLNSVWEFTLHVLETAGGVRREAMDAFLRHGHTERNALEVVMGIGTYTLSTFANRMTEGAGLDAQTRPPAPVREGARDLEHHS